MLGVGPTPPTPVIVRAMQFSRSCFEPAFETQARAASGSFAPQHNKAVFLPPPTLCLPAASEMRLWRLTGLFLTKDKQGNPLGAFAVQDGSAAEELPHFRIISCRKEKSIG